MGDAIGCNTLEAIVYHQLQRSAVQDVQILQGLAKKVFKVWRQLGGQDRRL